MGDVLNVLNVKRVVNKVKERSKLAFVDLDLVAGLSTDEFAVNFLIQEVKVDGMISKQRNAIACAKKQNTWAILKVFAHDSISVETSVSSIEACKPDALDILPGVAAPFALPRLQNVTGVPIGISGFIHDQEADIARYLQMGIRAVHTHNRQLWGRDLKSFL
jgi:glycerol uptake operon antiterminator